jgi:hypothetical protein
MTRQLVPLIAIVALCSLGAGECGAPPDETTGGAGTGGPAPTCICPTAPATVAHLPLECLCTASSTGPLNGAFLCSRTVADLTADARCASGGAAFRNMGCDKVSYEPGGGFGTLVFTFRAGGHLPSGVFTTGSTPFGPCAAAGATTYVYGDVLLPVGHEAATAAEACATETGCVICGGSDVPGPRCQ